MDPIRCTLPVAAFLRPPSMPLVPGVALCETDASMSQSECVRFC